MNNDKDGPMKAAPVKVSVIMGVYNQMDRTALDEAVDSILAQTMPDFEFIIYDDGSFPEAAQYIQKQGEKDPRICICGHEQNHGLAFSLNACVSLSRGQYIARMDADDVAAPERLERQTRFMDAHPEVDWCGSNAYLFDGKTVWGCREMPERPTAEDYLRFSPYIHPTVMYRRELLEKYRYSTLNETLHCEDYEIFMRLLRKGYHGYNIQENLLYYRENMDSYNRRTIRHRVNETKVRYQNFKRLGILFPKGWFFVLRPLLGIVVPKRLIQEHKRKESEKIYAARREKAPVLRTGDRQGSPAESGDPAVQGRETAASAR